MFETRLLPRKQLRVPTEPLRVARDTEGPELLTESLREVGQLQPLVVKPFGDGDVSHKAMTDVARLDDYIKAGLCFEIIDGHRRFLAAERAGLDLLRCTVVNTDD